MIFDPLRHAERCLQDAMTEALPDYWENRPRVFDLVHPEIEPLPLDTNHDVVVLAPASAQTALACRRHAYIIRECGLPGYITDEISDVIAEVA
jgi:hypothetical protein